MRILIRLVIAAVLCLMLSAALRVVPQIIARGSIPLAGPAPHSFPAGTARMYRVTADWSALRAMSRGSLRDERGLVLRIGLRAIPNHGPDIEASGDGSRLVVMANLHPGKQHVASGDQMLSLYDARTGTLLSAHHPATPLSMLGVSVDGALAYGENANLNLNDPCAATRIYLLDTHTGQILRRVTLAAHPWDSILASPQLDRLYTVTTPDHVNCTPQGVYRPSLSAYDLQTGQVGSMQLRRVLAGEWLTNRKVNGQPVIEDWQPGVALSPDGSQLAILDGHSDMLTLLDARMLTVKGSEPLVRPQTSLDALASLAGLAPTSAEAKGEIDGSMLQMRYAPDGHALIVVGTRLRPDKRRFYSSSQSLGIRRVDIADGQVSAWLHNGQTLYYRNNLWIAPDGSAVYSLVQKGWTRRTGWLFTLQRHNPSTLRVLARRTFTQNGWVDLLFLR